MFVILRLQNQSHGFISVFNLFSLNTKAPLQLGLIESAMNGWNSVDFFTIVYLYTLQDLIMCSPKK